MNIDNATKTHNELVDEINACEDAQALYDLAIKFGRFCGELIKLLKSSHLYQDALDREDHAEANKIKAAIEGNLLNNLPEGNLPDGKPSSAWYVTDFNEPGDTG